MHVKGHVKTKHIHFGEAAEDRDDVGEGALSKAGDTARA